MNGREGWWTGEGADARIQGVGGAALGPMDEHLCRLYDRADELEEERADAADEERAGIEEELDRVRGQIEALVGRVAVEPSFR